MSFFELPGPLRTAWDVATGQAEPITETKHGWYNTPQNQMAPHLDASTYRSSSGELEGLSFGMGLLDAKTKDSSVRLADARASFGRFTDRDGADAFGYDMDAGLAETQGGMFGTGTASANARAKFTSKGAEFGIGADGPQISMQGAESGFASDQMLRAGFSPIGPGFSLRGHWADDDGDGHRELGFGADLGDFSGDFTTEDPLRSLARYATYNVIGGRAFPLPGDSKERNWTSDAIAAASSLFGHFAD